MLAARHEDDDIYKRFMVFTSSFGELMEDQTYVYIYIYIRASNSTYTNILTFNNTQT